MLLATFCGTLITFLFKSINDDHNRLEDEINLKKVQLIKLSPESEEYTKLEQSIKDMELQLKDSDKSFLAGELLRYKKVYTSDSIASKVAKIETYEDLSKRNVATSRMAKLLGIEDMIAKSDMATVTINGKTMTGTIMEEVKGTIVEDSKTKAAGEETSVKYSPEAFKQLMNLQVFDVICGQVDRHTGNYLGELEKKKDGRYSIQGRDNGYKSRFVKDSGDGKEWESALNKYKKSLVGIKRREGDNIAEEFVKKTSYLKMNLV